jgi:hypothetical protein
VSLSFLYSFACRNFSPCDEILGCSELNISYKFVVNCDPKYFDEIFCHRDLLR